MFKKKNIFEKIDQYLTKKTHENVLSIYLDEFNGNRIYIRFDYVRNLLAYKIIWVDLNFVDEKSLEEYLNMQIVTKILSENLVSMLNKFILPEKECLNDLILGDHVEIKVNNKEHEIKYVFDRFLPLEWQFLIDPLVIIFSYLPRSMDVFLNEMFAKFDGLEENYNSLKPVKFDIFKSKLETLFKPNAISRGKKDYEDGLVLFLEKRENRYIAVVDAEEPAVIIIDIVNDEYIRFWCNCLKEGFCKHMCSIILAIRNNDYNNFYKIKYLTKSNDLLDKVTKGIYSLCFGVEGDNLLVIDDDAKVLSLPIIKNGKVMIEVLEENDELSLSKIIDSYKKKD